MYVTFWKHVIISAVRSSIEEFEDDNLGSEFSWVFNGPTLQKKKKKKKKKKSQHDFIANFTYLIKLVIYKDALLLLAKSYFFFK